MESVGRHANERERVPSAAVEITPAMTQAGVKILVDHYDAVGGSVDELVAAEIFKEMWARKDS